MLAFKKDTTAKVLLEVAVTCLLKENKKPVMGFYLLMPLFGVLVILNIRILAEYQNPSWP